jgi:hypothetical protein
MTIPLSSRIGLVLAFVYVASILVIANTVA